jgi:hypothetical protein
MTNGKYIDPITWELVTVVGGVETNRTSNASKILTHITKFGS